VVARTVAAREAHSTAKTAAAREASTPATDYRPAAGPGALAARFQKKATARSEAAARAAHFKGETATARKASCSLQRLLLVQLLILALLFVQLSLLLQLAPKERGSSCRLA
jgi:hypothetical protein